MININANLIEAPVKTTFLRDTEEVSVANFTLVKRYGKGKEYIHCAVYGDKVTEVMKLSKDDFVHVFGKEKISQGKDGKEYMSLKVYSAKLLKAKEQVNTNQNTKETKKTSALGKLKKYKEKTGEKSREQSSPQKEKSVER